MGYVSNNDKGLNSLFFNNLSLLGLVVIDHDIIILDIFLNKKKITSLNVSSTSDLKC